MIKLRSLPLCILASVFSFASISTLAQNAAPAVRVVNPIDETQLVTLTHTVHPLANAANDRGPAPDGMRLDRVQVVLQRSPSQEAALRQLVSQILTPGSPTYHHWLTPDQFGAQFGAADQDISTIETWLGNHGFSVTKVAAGKGAIEFSGSVAQMRETFHTQIHKYVVDGATHYANANNPQIPAALAPVISGFASLNNFHPKSYLQKLGEATYNASTHQVTPDWTYGNSSGVSFVLAPSDFAVQYDVTPLYNAGVNGTGQTIAIVNDSNININLVNQYRTLFNLPANPPQVIIDGNDPGVDGINNPDGPNYDSNEAYLDVEQAGAIAPDATIDLVIAADTALQTGLILGLQQAIYSNVAPVISLSFGACEASVGSSNALLNALYEQAAAQGQTVVVSTGDSGSANCDSASSEYAELGQAVSGFASTPYNVAVGGTDFYYSDYNSGSSLLDTQIQTYWSTSPSQTPSTSLLKVIPEQPWNDSQYGLNIQNYYVDYTGSTATTIGGGGGGASNCAINGTFNSNGGTVTCGAGYPKPAWQTGTGVPADGVRDLPDLSLFAANGLNYSFYAICASDGDCQPASSGNLVQITGLGGTSAAAPSFAGIMALVNQKYGPQGQADFVLYPMKAQFPAAFHDITVGTNSVPCETGTTNCIVVSNPIVLDGVTEGQIGSGTTPWYNAAAGYNLATGLGSLDVNQLVTNWTNVKFAATTTTMTPSSTSFAHDTAITIRGTVSGSGTPTGSVALMTDSPEAIQHGQGTFALSSGAYSNTAVNFLPGGTYNIWVNYGGDGTNAASSSAKTQITVTPDTPGMNLNLFNAALGQYFTSSSNPGTTVDYGTQLMLSAMVGPTSVTGSNDPLQNCIINGTGCSSLSYTIPTGTVTFNDNSNTINTAVVNAEGDAEYNAPFAIGSHSVTATYNGDQSYNKYTSSAIPFTVVKDSPAMGVDASNETSQGALIASQPTVFNVIVENGAQYNAYAVNNGSTIAPVPVLPPTGTVVVTSSPSGISGTVTLSSGVDPSTGAQAGIGTLTVAAGALTASSYTVSLVYSGDSNYQGNQGSPVLQAFPIVSATGLQASTTTAAMTGSISPNTSITVSGTVTGTGAVAPTGNCITTGVLIFSSGNTIACAPLTAGTGDVSTFSVLLNSQTLFQGANFVTVQYTGDTNYAPSAFNLTSSSAISNPLADFSLVPYTTEVAISAGGGSGSGTDTINATSVNGFSGTVSLACAAASPLTCTIISPNPSLTSGSSTTSALNINVPSGATNGTYNVSVTGKDSTGEYIHTLGITVDVTGATTTPTFALSSTGSITMAQGATGTSTVNITPANSFTGTVNLSCSVAPPTGATSPVTCSVPPSESVTGTSAVPATLTATSTSTTTAGSYVITVTGISGSITQTATVNVTVTSTASLAYTFTASQPSSAISPGSNATSTITVTGSGGYAGNVTLSCSLTSSPTGASDLPSCSITSGSPVSLSATTTSGTATATVTTTAATADLIYPKLNNGKRWLGAGSGALLALLVFFGIPARRRSWRSMLGILVVMAALGVMSSCGGGSSGGGGGGGGGTSNPGTSSGNYTFTVTSSGSATSNPAPGSQTFTVSVN